MIWRPKKRIKKNVDSRAMLTSSGQGTWMTPLSYLVANFTAWEADDLLMFGEGNG